MLVFQLCLLYIHGQPGCLSFESLEHAWSLRAASALLQMPPYSKICDDYIATFIDKKHAVQIFAKALEAETQLLLEKLRKVILKHPKHVLACNDLKKLNVDALIEILRWLDKRNPPELILAGILHWGSDMEAAHFREAFETKLFHLVHWHKMPKKSMSSVVKRKCLSPEKEHLAMTAMVSGVKLDAKVGVSPAEDEIECQVGLAFTCRHGFHPDCGCQPEGIEQLILQTSSNLKETMLENPSGPKEVTLNREGLNQLLKTRRTSNAFLADEKVQLKVCFDEDESAWADVKETKVVALSLNDRCYIVINFPPIQPTGNRVLLFNVSFDMKFIKEAQKSKLSKAGKMPTIGRVRDVTDEFLNVQDWFTKVKGEIVASSAMKKEELKGLKETFVFIKIN